MIKRAIGIFVSYVVACLAFCSFWCFICYIANIVFNIVMAISAFFIVQFIFAIIVVVFDSIKGGKDNVH